LESGISADALVDNMRNYAFLRSKWEDVELILKKFLIEAEQ
jgi:hypothetical protein